MAEKLKTLRLILGDQLNHQHSWYNDEQEGITYVFMEMRQETDYVTHHIQKVIGFFSAMRNFADHLKERDHDVIYFKINDPKNEHDLGKNLEKLILGNDFKKFEYQLPDEYRLDEQLKEICNNLSIETEAFDTEHFFTKREDLENFFKGKKQLIMEYFYRDMRKKHGILMTNAKDPEGGKWNFDKSNRKKWKGEPEIPHERGFRKDVSEIYAEIKKAEIKTIGTVNEKKFNWPTSREDSLSVLNYFCKNLLLHFGDFQDALHTEQEYLIPFKVIFQPKYQNDKS